MTEPVKRFNVFPYLDDGVAELDITHDEDGGYVFADDHDRVVQGLHAEIEEWSGTALQNGMERHQLRAEVERLRVALEHIRVMQLRGFIVLGDKANGLMQAALSGGEELADEVTGHTIPVLGELILKAKAAPQAEPVAWIVPDFGFLFPTKEAARRYLRNIKDSRSPVAVYTHPAQR